jgi:bifunctional non-homologous end joining protein LigD
LGVASVAVRVEDHPLAYAGFSGTIPQGQYGAGEVSVSDRGPFESLDPADTIADGLAAGKLSFALHGRRLKGRFALMRMCGKGKRENWLLIKGRDRYARPGGAAAESARRPAPAKQARKSGT